MKLLACQIEVPRTRDAEARDAHVSRVAACIDRKLAAEPADLVVLPELASVEYSRCAFSRLTDLAEDLDGPTFHVFSRVAARHATTVVYGIPRADSGRHFISQVVVGPDGRRLGLYDKLHLAQFGACAEKDFFQAGCHLLVFEVGGMRVAPLVCYDLRFPELFRTLCLEHRVDLLIHCAAFFRDESFPSWHAFVTCRAMENQVYMLSLNRAGAYYGASLFCPPWCDASHATERFGSSEEYRTLVVEPALIDEVRARYRFRADRREDYARLALAPGPAPEG